MDWFAPVENQQKQDSQFITVFSLVIGILVAVAVVLFGLARVVAAHTEDVVVYQDPLYVATVQERTAPFAREAIAGQDNSALKIAAPAGAGPAVALAVPKNGMELFQQVCSTCHGPGLVGAPKAGDRAAWASAIAEGKPTLYQHALNGYTGSTGAMPAKGGRTDLPDALIKQGVDYMLSLVGH
ncbi:MAG TPA: c-type cytochrome [Steroidobacteraceae bacterium]|nr:c-type cytochrome [Steroidobacteraceae bacterium]